MMEEHIVHASVDDIELPSSYPLARKHLLRNNLPTNNINELTRYKLWIFKFYSSVLNRIAK